MTMTTGQGLIIIAMVSLGTLTMRFLPFLLFPDNKPLPEAARYLGSVLPFSVIGLLVVYCMKHVRVTVSPYGLPELIAVLVIAGLHLWKKKPLLSIAGGTAVYMLLMQLVFA